MEDLVDRLASILAKRSRTPKPIPMVIPSVTFADYLQIQLAGHLGVCMGLDLLTPLDFVRRLLNGCSGSDWSPIKLCWHLLPLIKRRSLNLGFQPDASIRDQFAVACQLADTFDQYAHYRPNLIRQWDSRVLNHTETTSECWQRELWQELNGSLGVEHPAVIAGKCGADGTFLENLANKCPEVVVIGSGAIDPLLIEVLGLLQKAGSKVFVHVVLPSLDYLGEIMRRGSLPSCDTAPELISAPAGHPLLESMGRQAVGSFLLLGKIDEQYTNWPEAGASPEQGGTLLQRLQKDVRALRHPAYTTPESEDASIRIHCCHGARREIEVLRDELLRAFAELPGLRPEDVHIVTPSLEEYAPLLPALLEGAGVNRGTTLGVRVTELPVVLQNPTVQALLAFLELARAGRFEASKLLEILQMQGVRRFLKVDDDDLGLERLRNVVIRSGLTRGLGEQPQGTLEPGTWGFARDRLVAGRWLGPEADALYTDGQPVLAVADQLGGDSVLLRQFLCWQRDLSAMLHEWGNKTLKPAEWAFQLRAATHKLLDFGEASDYSELRAHLDLLESSGGCELVDAAVILDWLESLAGERGRRTTLSGKITAGRFKQLQNIPCRVLAMVGMQDGNFPGKARSFSWDLLHVQPQAWDRNARVDDRQMFLDGILATRDRLIITASSQNVRTGKSEPLSSCVDELLRVCNEMGAKMEDLVVRHALQPFWNGYYSELSELPRSFDRDMHQVACNLMEKDRVAGAPLWDPQKKPVEMETPEEISLADIASFWKNPAAAFLNRRGIAAGREAEDDLDLDRHPLKLDGLEKREVKETVVRSMIDGGGTPERLRCLLEADRKIPRGQLGNAVWQASKSQAEALGKGIREALGVSVGVVIKVAGGPCLSGSIQLSKDGKHLLAWHIGKFEKPRHWLVAWINALASAAAGHSLPTLLLDDDHPDQDRALCRLAIERDAALATLNHLVAGFLEGCTKPLCYAPQTSEAYWKQRAKLDVRDALAKAIASDWWKADVSRGEGEGQGAAAWLAWRDLDPLQHADDWDQWAKAVAAPLMEWSNIQP